MVYLTWAYMGLSKHYFYLFLPISIMPRSYFGGSCDDGLSVDFFINDGLLRVLDTWTKTRIRSFFSSFTSKLFSRVAY